VRYDRERIGRVHVITDTVIQERFGHDELARLAIAGGAGAIQLRDKRLAHEDLVTAARKTLAVCRREGTPLIVNDNVAVAAEVGADGVHLGREDASIVEARAILGPAAVIGGSAGSVDDALAVEDEGADYIGFGHIYETGSKRKKGPPVGLDALRQVSEAVAIPVIAIGGITAETAGDVINAGAWGVAVIGAVCGSDDPEFATRAIRAAVDFHRG
jgi:thiamine-phosphate pyrophosphorylase